MEPTFVSQQQDSLVVLIQCVVIRRPKLSRCCHPYTYRVSLIILDDHGGSSAPYEKNGIRFKGVFYYPSLKVKSVNI